jgi:hypothetical protein
LYELVANGLGLAAGGDLEAPTFNLPQMQIKSTKLHLTTETPISCRCFQWQFYVISHWEFCIMSPVNVVDVLVCFVSPFS